MKKISAMNDDEDDDESYQPFPIQRHFIKQCNRKNDRDRCKWPRDEGRWAIDSMSKLMMKVITKRMMGITRMNINDTYKSGWCRKV